MKAEQEHETSEGQEATMEDLAAEFRDLPDEPDEPATDEPAEEAEPETDPETAEEEPATVTAEAQEEEESDQPEDEEVTEEELDRSFQIGEENVSLRDLIATHELFNGVDAKTTKDMRDQWLRKNNEFAEQKHQWESEVAPMREAAQQLQHLQQSFQLQPVEMLVKTAQDTLGTDAAAYVQEALQIAEQDGKYDRRQHQQAAQQHIQQQQATQQQQTQAEQELYQYERQRGQFLSDQERQGIWEVAQRTYLLTGRPPTVAEAHHQYVQAMGAQPQPAPQQPVQSGQAVSRPSLSKQVRRATRGKTIARAGGSQAPKTEASMGDLEAELKKFTGEA